MSLSEHEIARNRAHLQYNTAHHLLNVTLPLVKDPKLLVGIVHNLSSALEYSLDALLAYEKKLNLIPEYDNTFNNDFNTKLTLFKQGAVLRHKIPESYFNLIHQLKQIQEIHKNCPVKFQRGNRIVMCTHDYNMHLLSHNEVKEYLKQTKEFLEITEHIISRK